MDMHPHSRGNRLISLVLCLLMLFTLCVGVVQQAEADEVTGRVKVTDLAYGRHVYGRYQTLVRSGKKVHYLYQAFKIKVPKAGYLTFHNYLDQTVDSVYFGLYSKPGDIITNKNCLYSASVGKGVRRYLIPVKKGTYYVCTFGFHPKKREFYDFSLNFTDHSAIDRNVSKATASLLKRGKTALVVAPEGYTYSRWYKLSLTKSQAITLNLFDQASLANLLLYDANLQPLSLKRAKEGVFTSGKLQRGTYYVELRPNCTYGVGVFKLSWH